VSRPVEVHFGGARPGAAEKDLREQKKYLSFLRDYLSALSDPAAVQVACLQQRQATNPALETGCPFDLFDDWENARVALWTVPLTGAERHHLFELSDNAWAELAADATPHDSGFGDLHSDEWSVLRHEAQRGQRYLDEAERRMASGAWAVEEIRLPIEFRRWD